NYNAYPNMPCLDAAGNFYMAWTWRETPAYESNHDLNYAKSTNGGVTWQRYDGTPYDLPICENGGTSDTNEFSMPIVSIPQNYSLINQAGMCLDPSNNPVIATWWAPGEGTNDRRQYMVVFPDTNGVWQTRQVSNRTNDNPSTNYLDSAVRDLGRPVVVCDKQNRIIVLYRDNFGSNGLTIVSSLPLNLTNQNQDAALSWNTQPGWGYQVQWCTNLTGANWNVAATLGGITGFLPLQYVQTNGVSGSQRFWRLQVKEGGF